MCVPLKNAWADFQAGSGTLLDLARLAGQAASALDNASAPLAVMLAEAAADLEYAHYADEAEDHLPAGRRILGPVLSRMNE